VQILKDLVEQSVDQTLHSLSAALEVHTGKKLSIPSMYRTVQRLGFTHKKVSATRACSVSFLWLFALLFRSLCRLL
jgi:transposase